VQRKPHGIVLADDGEKMSKSKGNAVDPQTIVKEYGVDTLRMYELFLGPHETQVSWNDQGIIGVKRFLDRTWEWVNKNQESRSKSQEILEKVQRALNRLIKKITEDIENFRFNTAISAFMGFLNEVKDEKVDLSSVRKFLAVLYPFAPHIAEELNQTLKGKKSLQLEPWPEFDKSKIIDKEVEIVVQINGKVRGRLNIAAESSEDQVKQEALKLEVVKKVLLQESIKRIIFVKNRLINLVI